MQAGFELLLTLYLCVRLGLVTKQDFALESGRPAPLNGEVGIVSVSRWWSTCPSLSTSGRGKGVQSGEEEDERACVYVDT